MHKAKMFAESARKFGGAAFPAVLLLLFTGERWVPGGRADLIVNLYCGVVQMYTYLFRQSVSSSYYEDQNSGVVLNSTFSQPGSQLSTINL